MAVRPSVRVSVRGVRSVSENVLKHISTFVAGGQSVRVNQPQASACAEERLLAVSMSDVELKSGN